MPPVALRDDGGQPGMHLASREDGSLLLAPGAAQKQLFFDRRGAGRTAPVRRLDYAVKAAKLQRRHLLKTEVQSIGFDVLKGVTRLAEAMDEVCVKFSYLSPDVGKRLAALVADFLSDVGLTESRRFNVCRHGAADVQADLLFVRGGK